MCGRFTQNFTWAEVYEFLNLLGTPRNLRPRYNIAPTTMIDVVRLDKDGNRELASMRWGLVPGWWKNAAKDAGQRRGGGSTRPSHRAASAGDLYASGTAPR